MHLDNTDSTPPPPNLTDPASLQRTYRYLRMGIGGTVLLIFVSVAVAMTQVGVLSSVSAYFYTPARTVFVGALIAASLGLLAISGTGVERALLDVAGLLAPLVALVPTPLVPGSVPGITIECGSADSCVPSAYHLDVFNGITTYLLVSVVIIVAAFFKLINDVPHLAWAQELWFFHVDHRTGFRHRFDQIGLASQECRQLDHVNHFGHRLRL